MKPTKTEFHFKATGTSTLLFGRRETATYTDTLIPRYQGNPLIEALPPILSDDDNTTFLEGSGSFVMHNQSIFSFVDFLRRNLGILVIDRTAFRDDLDIDFLKWDSTPEGLKQAVLNQLGLELVPAKESVEFLVVEKSK